MKNECVEALKAYGIKRWHPLTFNSKWGAFESVPQLVAMFSTSEGKSEAETMPNVGKASLSLFGLFLEDNGGVNHWPEGSKRVQVWVPEEYINDVLAFVEKLQAKPKKR
jgi:hypothetical protein